MGQKASYTVRVRKRTGQEAFFVFDFKNVNGHIEVYDEYGDFLFSADTMGEAYMEAYAA